MFDTDVLRNVVAYLIESQVKFLDVQDAGYQAWKSSMPGVVNDNGRKFLNAENLLKALFEATPLSHTHNALREPARVTVASRMESGTELRFVGWSTIYVIQEDGITGLPKCCTEYSGSYPCTCVEDGQ